MKNLEELAKLYRQAIEIEKESQSPRIMKLHDQTPKKYCKVSLGIVDSRKTKYLFVLANPGVAKTENEYSKRPLDNKELADNHFDKYRSMEIYMAQTEPLARKTGVYINEFSKGMKENCTMSFGVTNVSMFHSKTIKELQGSFLIEVEESFQIVGEDFRLPQLQMLIFSGVDQPYFFHKLYRVGSEVNINEPDKIGRFHFDSLWTTLKTINQRILCIFTVHLSGTRGLSTDNIRKMAQKSVELLKTENQRKA